jgi:hypothetical protein
MRSTHSGPASRSTAIPGTAATKPTTTEPMASLELASTSSSGWSTAAGTNELFATEYAFDSTRWVKAAGNSSSPSTTAAMASAPAARPTDDPITITRRPRRDPSMAGPRKGATTANGAMVSTSDSATRPRAADGEMLKNNEPASAIVTRASPAMASAWVVASREKGEGPNRAPDRRGRQPAVIGPWTR